jgi:DNA-binding LacI/PurR family transcriptional regulator
MSSNLPVLRVDPKAPLPLATQLSQQLCWLIASGELSPGDHLPPIRQLAGELGINLHTVRAGYQQLEADGLVSTRQGRRATVLPYDRVKVAARAPDVLSSTIGVIIPAFASFYGPMLDGIESTAAERSAMVFICNAHGSTKSVVAYLDRLTARQVDGIIVAFDFLPPGTVLPVPGQRPAIVSVDYPGAPGPSVEFDLEGAALQATAHLIEHGHQRIGYLTPPPHTANLAPKNAGYHRALDDAGRIPDPGLIAKSVDFSIEAGHQAAIQLLDQPDPPTGIVAATDFLAIGAMHACTSLGLDIPGDIALVGIDDIDMAAIVRPALTTVALPAQEAGIRAATMLQELIAGQTPEPSHLVLDTHLIIRESCGCPAP